MKHGDQQRTRIQIADGDCEKVADTLHMGSGKEYRLISEAFIVSGVSKAWVYDENQTEPTPLNCNEQ